MKIRILIINDEPMVLEAQKRLVEAHLGGKPGVELVVYTYPNALRHTLSTPPDLILADPGASEGLDRLLGYDTKTAVMCVTGHPLSAIPDQPFPGVRCWKRVAWGVDGSLTRAINEWYAEEFEFDLVG